MSRQSFGLKENILEADKIYQSYPLLHEVHPEVSFKAISGRDLQFGKKTRNGLMERLGPWQRWESNCSGRRT